jgi:hypothetical protein
MFAPFWSLAFFAAEVSGAIAFPHEMEWPLLSDTDTRYQQPDHTGQQKHGAHRQDQPSRSHRSPPVEYQPVGGYPLHRLAKPFGGRPPHANVTLSG